MDKTDSDIDSKIGARIKQLRTDWNISQSELAEKIDVSFQQIQKYEKGKTNISVKRLMQISGALHVPLSTLLTEENDDSRIASPDTGYGEKTKNTQTSLLVNEEEKRIVQLFRKIKNKKVREGLVKQLQGINEIEKNQ